MQFPHMSFVQTQIQNIDCFVLRFLNRRVDRKKFDTFPVSEEAVFECQISLA